MEPVVESQNEIKQTWSLKEDMGNGIWVYRDVLPKDLDIINRLESILGASNNSFNWQPAYVGYMERMPEYRDCVDFKYKKENLIGYPTQAAKDLVQIWQDCYDRKSEAVKDYCKMYNIQELRYWESFNFVKYEPGHHFMEHHDHGYSYNCTVSLVSYLNDDYEGGEIYFRLQQLNIKPKAGDLYIFPSNFMYPHQAMPVKSGTKYSLVTMLDYSSKYHNPKFYQETGD